MSYRIQPETRLSKNIRRIICKQIDKAIEEINTEGHDRHRVVHQVRKRCKKIRAVLRLVRPHSGLDYALENAFFRDAARLLSELRDAQVVLETYDHLMDVFGPQIERSSFEPIRQALLLRHKQIVEEIDMEERLAEFLSRLHDARNRVANWSLDTQGFKPITAGLGKTHRRARKTMRLAYKTLEDVRLHTWRKRVKYHLYHARLLQPLWPAMLDAYIAELTQLSDLLGDDHNLAVLRQIFLTSSEDLGPPQMIRTLLGLLEQQRGQLQLQARTLGERLFAEKSKALLCRWHQYWNAWHAERKRAQDVLVGVQA